MARTWLSIEVELVSGRGEQMWPRPGRVLIARRTFTFRQLATAIDRAFARWDLSHLHHFVLPGDIEVVPLDYWDDPPDGALDDATTTLSKLELGSQFAYEFDLGDGWEHLCTVAPQRLDPLEVYGVEPDEPAVVFGWGDLPDQYGRTWKGDDSGDEPPSRADAARDLPPLLPGWGDWKPPPARALPEFN